MSSLPTIFVVDASVDITGAVIAASRAAALLREDVRSVLVLPAESRVPDEAVDGFAEVLRLPMVQLRKSVRSLLGYLPGLLGTALRLRREMRLRGCERLQMNDFYLMQGAMLRLLGFRGRIVTWIRIDPRRFGRLGRLWLWAGRRSSDRLVAVSRFILRCLPRGLSAALVYDAFAPPSDAGPNPAGERSKRLIFVGNYIAGKGQDHALAAFEPIAPRFPEARLCFFGSDMGLAKNAGYRRELEARAAAGPAFSQVSFAGQMRDLAPVYSRAFAALNFSASESFSLTCQEASAFGLPIVATRSGGPEEIIEDGETGYLVAVGDVAAMADRMARLLSQPDEAAAMGRAGQRLVALRFSPLECRERLVEVLGLGPSR